MPTYDVVIRAKVWVEGETREDAAELARTLMQRAWNNMALGCEEIPKRQQYHREFTIDRKQSKLDGRQRLPYGDRT